MRSIIKDKLKEKKRRELGQGSWIGSNLCRLNPRRSVYLPIVELHGKSTVAIRFLLQNSGQYQCQERQGQVLQTKAAEVEMLREGRKGWGWAGFAISKTKFIFRMNQTVSTQQASWHAFHRVVFSQLCHFMLKGWLNIHSHWPKLFCVSTGMIHREPANQPFLMQTVAN